MVDVLVILDGASEPLREGPTSLERARTPVLDRLAAEGFLSRLQTVPAGLPAGSETAIPGLLGWTPRQRLDRAAIEAAAHGIELGYGECAWRVDRRDRADAASSAQALSARLLDHDVHHLAGHRMLVVGREPPPGFGRELLVWPRGTLPPRLLDEDTVVIGARGAAVGIARLMGARTIVPPGATGGPDSDLAAKAAAALGVLGEDELERVVVHVGAADEAAHARDADAKAAAIQAADALLLAPLVAALRARGGTLRVCPDHGCDPLTGEHDDAPVPCLDWPAALGAGGKLTERAAAGLTISQLPATLPAAHHSALEDSAREAVSA